MKIILVGYMGSGKTAIGGLLSEKLGLPFLDLDHQISKRQGMTVPEIFERKGEIAFRKMEMETLEELLSEDRSYVLSLGGGTPCYGRNLELIKQAANARMIYLKASLETLTARLMKERMSRPLISHLESVELLEDFVRKHLFERAYYYNQSEIIVDVNSSSIVGIVTEIQDRLN